MEKKFTNHVCKGLVSWIYKELLQINNTQTKKLKRHKGIDISSMKIQIYNKHIKRCSKSVTIREVEIKTSMKYHFPPTRMNIKKTDNNKFGAYGEKLELLCIARNLNVAVTLVNSLTVP